MLITIISVLLSILLFGLFVFVVRKVKVWMDKQTPEILHPDEYYEKLHKDLDKQIHSPYEKDLS